MSDTTLAKLNAAHDTAATVALDGLGLIILAVLVGATVAVDVGTGGRVLVGPAVRAVARLVGAGR